LGIENFDKKLEDIILDISYYYNGGINIDWLENQPYTKVLRIKQHLINILKSQQKRDNGF
jgi:hypothetical protein